MTLFLTWHVLVWALYDDDGGGGGGGDDDDNIV
jgi:hypothetical protein